MALTLRRLLHLPLRQTQGFVESLLVLMGLDEWLDAPTYSTGLKVYGEGEWKVRKHGWTTRRTWRELHLGVNADTQEIVAHQLTAAYADYARQLKPLYCANRYAGRTLLRRWRLCPMACPPAFGVFADGTPRVHRSDYPAP